MDAVLLALDDAIGAIYLSYSRLTASSFYFLIGFGGIVVFFFMTLASSKNLTSSSRVWNLYD